MNIVDLQGREFGQEELTQGLQEDLAVALSASLSRQYPITSNSAWEVTPYRLAIEKLASMGGALPLDLFDGEKKRHNHDPLKKQLSQPQAGFLLQDILSAIIVQLFHSRICFVRARNKRGSLEVLNSESVSYDDRTRKFTISTGTGILELPKKQLVIFRMPTLTPGEIIPKPNYKLAEKAMQLYLAVNQAPLNHFGKSGSQSSKVVAADLAHIKADKRKDYVTKFLSAAEGNRLSFLHLKDAKANVLDLSTNFKDSSLATTQTFALQEIARITGIHPALLGAQEGSSYNTASEANRALLAQVLGPVLTRIEQGFTAFYGDQLNPNLRFKFDVDQLLAMDPKSQAEIRNMNLSNGGTINEARAARGLSPVENGDDALYSANLINTNNMGETRHENFFND